MNEIVTVNGGQSITTTLAIASGTEVNHASVIKLVRAGDLVNKENQGAV